MHHDDWEVRHPSWRGIRSRTPSPWWTTPSACCGHVPMIEAPDTSLEVVRAWRAQVATAGPAGTT